MLGWLAHNWFDTLQTVGIVGGLLFAGISLRFDHRARRTEIALTLSEAHRQIWELPIEKPALERVSDPKADIVERPPSPEERRFVIMLASHIDCVLQAAKAGVFEMPVEMEHDIADLITLPVPKAVIQGILPYQRTDFRRYLETILRL